MKIFDIKNVAQTKKDNTPQKLDRFERLNSFIGSIHGSATDEQIKLSLMKRWL